MKAADAIAVALAAGAPGAVALGRGREGGDDVAVGGFAARYRKPGELLAEPVPVNAQTLFDLASVTKVLVAVAALALAQRGELDLDEPIGELFPEAAWRAAVTPRHLLAHTSGLPATLRHPTGAARDACVAAVAACALGSAPGAGYRYSCVGYQVLGEVLARASGEPLPALVDRVVSRPLGMTSVTWTPDPARCAATEWRGEAREGGRGMVRGAVHDHAAWVLGGAGNAGAFATAADVARLGDVLVDGGGLLGATHHRLLVTDQTGGPTTYGQGLGPRIGDDSFLPPGGGWVGHTGFTGTSLAVHPERGEIRVLLTNAVHPVRGRVDLGPVRRAFG